MQYQNNTYPFSIFLAITLYTTPPTTPHHPPQVRYQSNINVENTSLLPRNNNDKPSSLMHSITVPGSCKLEKPFQFRVQRSTPRDLRQGAQCKYYSRDRVWIGRGLFLRGLKFTNDGSLIAMCACTFCIMLVVSRLGILFPLSRWREYVIAIMI